jgi:hypothetical protein
MKINFLTYENLCAYVCNFKDFFVGMNYYSTFARFLKNNKYENLLFT